MNVSSRWLPKTDTVFTSPWRFIRERELLSQIMAGSVIAGSPASWVTVIVTSSTPSALMTIVAFCGSVVVLLCASTVIVPSAVPSAFLRVSQPASVVAFQLTFSALTSIVLGVSGVAVKVRVPGVALSERTGASSSSSHETVPRASRLAHAK